MRFIIAILFIFVYNLFSISFAESFINGKTAIVQAINKTTGKVEKLRIPVSESGVFDRISILVRTCKYTPPNEETENAVFIEVTEYTITQETNASKNVTEVTQSVTKKENIFSGWLFSSSPGLSAMENKQYDVWLVRCE